MVNSNVGHFTFHPLKKTNCCFTSSAKTTVLVFQLSFFHFAFFKSSPASFFVDNMFTEEKA
ncbi:hypothetical protein EGI32_09935 [Ferruginibacter sp. HRS2-29]|nr:hypothetical protein [Ferruginibacter sp. HRS2-29]